MLTVHLCSTNIVIILGMMQVSKRVPFDDPNVLNIVRAVYLLSNLIIAGLYIVSQIKINKTKGMLGHHSNLSQVCSANHGWNDL